MLDTLKKCLALNVQYFTNDRTHEVVRLIAPLRTSHLPGLLTRSSKDGYGQQTHVEQGVNRDR